MTFVLVGGGPTGVELAGALGEIARQSLKHDFRSIHPEDARIILVEAMDRVLPPFPPGRSVSAQRQLERARRHGADEHPRDRHRRAPGPRRLGRRRGVHPGPDRAVGGRRHDLDVRADRREGRRRRDRPGRPRAGRAGPHAARPPGGLRRGRRRRAAVEGGQAHAGRGAGGDPGRLVRGEGHPPPRARAAVTSRSATATTGTPRSSAGCRGSPTSAGSARSGSRAASRPGCCGSGSTSPT